jgi:small subunit ribosomal protein S8e
MGISRDGRHKRRLTGGRMPCHQKKRQFECGKPAANTKLAAKRIRLVRKRGGDFKHRALRLNMGNFMWQSEGVTKKSKIVNVVYNPVSNELVRTNTLTKGTIVFIDATPFTQYVQGHYFAKWDTNKDDKVDWAWETKAENKDFKLDKTKKDVSATAKFRRINTTIETAIQNAMNKGSLMCRITSRPGQMGRCDGLILEGKELDFYTRHMKKK